MREASTPTDDRVDRVAARVRGRLEPAQAELAERFIHQFYHRVPPRDLLGRSSDDLYGAALSLWDFAQHRQPGTAKVRVFNSSVEGQGWSSPHTIVEIVNDDMPFLVDTVAAELNRLNMVVRLIIHPIVHLERDVNHRLITLYDSKNDDAEQGEVESFMHVEVSEQPNERHEEIGRSLEAVLTSVRWVVADWQAMRRRCEQAIDDLRKHPPPLAEDEIEEAVAFLQWLDDDHFTYIGFREYQFQGEGEDAVGTVLPESGLGVLRDEEFTVFDGMRHLGGLPAEVRDFVRRPELVRITKANRRSMVHRSVYMDCISVKSFDGNGKVTGERLFIGLFTSQVYSHSPLTIPILRQKLRNTLRRAELKAKSHDGKRLLHILDNYPRDELFQTSEDDLLEISTGILYLQERQRIALFCRYDPFERFVSCLVYVPRDRYDTRLRELLQGHLSEAFEGPVVAYYTHMTDEPLARLHCIVKTTPGKVPQVDSFQLEAILGEAARSWEDRLGDALVAHMSEERGLRTFARYQGVFPSTYQSDFSAQDALIDIDLIDAVLDKGGLEVNLYRPPEARQEEVRFKIYGKGRPAALSDLLPRLELMGLKVLNEIPYVIRPGDVEREAWIRDFYMVTEDGSAVDLVGCRSRFHEAFGRVWQGEMENDGFNRLVLAAGLSAREVTVLRAYYRYLHQIQIPFSQTYVERTLASNPELTRRLIDLFMLRFEPNRSEGREDRCKERAREIETLLDAVQNLDEDRILRRFLNLVLATTRTNYFQPDEQGREKDYLAVKFEGELVEGLPRPRPFREIFIYSPKMEAVHLRGGAVARGGIRWSDRKEDFRTEILGLMKSQMVKNAVIVPVGSKGGFVVKDPASFREELRSQVATAYKTMISGLLDLTDNLVAGKIQPPSHVECWDGEDSYLVVAADRGTATFSDLANEISSAYGFWLDDAFASGGSAGYDHKKMGITARGAWESVQRHFMEMGKDIQKESVTVIGVGDMAGDVFGNGMLLSRSLRLVGAFNHQHIFVDPNPDPALSWQERERIFRLAGSSWSDYDSTLLSPGGGVFDRQSKWVQISPEMAALFDLTEERMTPNEIIHAMLRARVELLWFGGIGTFVKASGESHLEAGDRSNDGVRVNATELRAGVVGEGANLAMTQRARVQYALSGGRVNTDFLDNSAGVDCSDHEVNLKILLGEVERAGELTRKERDQLLVEMTDEVARLVLRDNYLQTQAISATQQRGVHLLDRLARFMRALEKVDRLDRRLEFLPDDDELEERFKKGLGFTRPELAVLLSYAKLDLYDILCSSDLASDGGLVSELIQYFPKPIRDRWPEQISHHRLRHELTATQITNELVNRMGITFVLEVRETLGVDASEVARSYVAAREIHDMGRIWRQVEELDHRVPATTQLAALAEGGRLLDRTCVWLLQESAKPLDVGREIETYAAQVRELSAGLESHLSSSVRDFLNDRSGAFERQGFPPVLAKRVAQLSLLVPSCDIVRTAAASGRSVHEVAQVYFEVGERFGFDWLRRATTSLPTSTAWDNRAVTAIVDDLLGHQSALTRSILRAVDGAPTEDLINAWIETHHAQVQRTQQTLDELQTFTTPSFPMLAVANRQLKALAGSQAS